MKFFNSILNVRQAARLTNRFHAMGDTETFKMKGFMEESLVMVSVGLKGTVRPKYFCFCLPDASGKRVPLPLSLLHILSYTDSWALHLCPLFLYPRSTHSGGQFFPQSTVTVMHWPCSRPESNWAD